MRFTLALVLALGFLVGNPAGALATGTYPAGSAGYDVSWPQCWGPLPHLNRGDFGIVGVTGGRPYTLNPCLQAEYAWASSGGMAPTLYINLEIGARTDGPRECAAADRACQAYNFGYQAALTAFQAAAEQTGGFSLRVGLWWLDVETDNYWSDSDLGANTMVVAGAIDFLHDRGREVGVYSTSYQWGEITGWYQFPGVPNWVAGAVDYTDHGKCRASLWPGGQVYLFQYLIGDFDQNVGC